VVVIYIFKDGRNILCWAAAYGFLPIVLYLVDMGAALEMKDKVYTCLLIHLLCASQIFNYYSCLLCLLCNSKETQRCFWRRRMVIYQSYSSCWSVAQTLASNPK
jgi:hypothetical protein